jgi:hypothetical protein
MLHAFIRQYRGSHLVSRSFTRTTLLVWFSWFDQFQCVDSDSSNLLIEMSQMTAPKSFA